MKHLSRVLSLALVIALSLGLVVTAGAIGEYKDYTDVEQIDEKYIEAIDVLSALKVIEGYEDKSFKPQREVTRAEAAKFVAYISIGTTAADKLAHRPSSFTDVATNHWANPFIEFGVERGLINGVGAGRFNPEGAVTGAQFSKLMLTALGYGAKDEYVGSSWELNAIVDGQTRGILTVDTDYSLPATREQVAQYSFNTIKPAGGKNFLVKLNSLINDYVLADQDSVLVSGHEQYLGAEVFGLRMNPAFTNEYGYTAHKWAVYANAITGKYRDGVVLATNTSGLAITGPIGLATITSPFYRVDLDDAVPVTYWKNGTQIVDEVATDGVGVANNLEESGERYTSWTEYNAVTTKIENAALTAYVTNYIANTNEGMAAVAAWLAVVNAGGTLAAADVMMGFDGNAPDNYSYSDSSTLKTDIATAYNTEYSALDPTPANRLLYRSEAAFKLAITEPVPPRSALEQANETALKKGVIVEFVDNNFNNRADKVILIEKSVRTVAAAPSVSAAGMVSIPGVTPRALPGTEIIYPTGLATGDIVLHHDTTEDGITVTHVDKAETVRGQMTSYNNRDITINFGGATYTISGLTGNFRQVAGFSNHTQFVATDSGNYNLEATGYFDDNGSLVQIVLDAPAPQNYVILLGVAGGFNVGTGYSYTIQAKALLTDGTVKIINITKIDGALAENQDQFDLDGSDGATAFDDGPIFSYVVDANGNYELTRQVDRLTNVTAPYNIGNFEIEDATVRNQISFLDNAGHTYGAARANDNTKFIVPVIDVMTGVTTYKVYQGVRSAPRFTLAYSVDGWYINDRSGFAAVVYLDGTLDNASSAVNYVYFVNPNSFTSTTPPVGSSYYTVQAIVNGEVKDVTLSITAYETVRLAMVQFPAFDGSDMADNWFLWVATYDDTGVITTVANVDSAPNYYNVDLDSSQGTTPGVYGVVTRGTGGRQYLYDNVTRIFYLSLGPGGVAFDSVVTGDEYFAGNIVPDTNNVITVQKSSRPNVSSDLVDYIYIIEVDGGLD